MADEFSSRELGAVVQPCPLARKKSTAWVEIELVGEDDRPIPWEEYNVILPSGESVKGYLDRDGFARLEQIEPPGMCRVSFPNLDQDAWSFIESAGPKSDPGRSA